LADFKNALGTVLLLMGCPGVQFMLAGPLPLYMSDKDSGLVVDLGFS
jgi:hypothetical protein